MTILDLLTERATTAFGSAGIPTQSDTQVRPATRPEFGDYQVNGVMPAARTAGANPRALAAAVVGHLQVTDIAESVEVAGPGFIRDACGPGYVLRVSLPLPVR